jgi:threonine/homoserine/homoserine lactone efflux protein
MLIFNAFIIGFTAAALPGAVQTTILQTALTGKWKDSFRFMLGAAFMDGSLMFLSFVGITQFITNIFWLKITIGILGVAYMLLLGITGLLRSTGKISGEDNMINKRTFLNGVILVALHPPTIFYFIGIAASISTTILSLPLIILASTSLFIGALTCFLLVLFIGLVMHKTKKQKLITVFHVLTCLVLIFFAIKLFYSLISWGNNSAF